MLNFSQSFIQPYWQLMRMDKPIGTFLLLWPTLWGLWIAGDGQPDPDLVTIFIVGAILMRAAGCIINDYADRDFDLHITRTRMRPLTSGKISIKAAMLLFLALMVFALILVMQLNPFTIYMAIVAASIACLYPFTKRFTHLPQGVLGVAFSMSILMAFTASNNQLPFVAWLLFAGNLFWTVAYDTQYALCDREDDLRIGIKSSAILFGDKVQIAIISLQILSLIFWVIIGLTLDLSWHFYLSLVIAIILMIYQYSLSKTRDSVSCLRAFINNSWVGGVIFLGIVLGLMKN